jgi:cell division protein ZapE
MSGPVRAAYDALITANELRPDPAQERAVAALDRLADGLENGASLLSRVFGSRQQGPAGAYLWGGVGRGKSMLMDLAFEHIEVRPKRRVHFHEFMLETHARLRKVRQKEQGDPIEPVAEEIASEAKLLCFDEMQVTNPADAMILSRLFGRLLEQGVKVVTTSNRPPRDLSRAFFQLTDYPVEDRAKVPSEELEVGGGRTLHVPKSLKGVAVFSFKRLCGQARGAADYLAIARRFHTVIIVGIPVMGPDMRNEAARFVTLIDALYEHKVKLLAAADAEPKGLYPSGDGSFEFQRTASRLEEMRSAEYLAEGHGTVS